ncbi:hypothetical protein EIQ09_10105 [Xanthomonas campestris pv. campestris]
MQCSSHSTQRTQRTAAHGSRRPSPRDAQRKDEACSDDLQHAADAFGDAYHATQSSSCSPIAAIRTNDFSRISWLAMIQHLQLELTPCALDPSWC